MNPLFLYSVIASPCLLCEYLLELSEILVYKCVFIFFIQYSPNSKPKVSSGIELVLRSIPVLGEHPAMWACVPVSRAAFVRTFQK